MTSPSHSVRPWSSLALFLVAAVQWSSFTACKAAGINRGSSLASATVGLPDPKDIGAYDAAEVWVRSGTGSFHKVEPINGNHAGSSAGQDAAKHSVAQVATQSTSSTQPVPSPTVRIAAGTYDINVILYLNGKIVASATEDRAECKVWHGEIKANTANKVEFSVCPGAQPPADSLDTSKHSLPDDPTTEIKVHAARPAATSTGGGSDSASLDDSVLPAEASNSTFALSVVEKYRHEGGASAKVIVQPRSDTQLTCTSVWHPVRTNGSTVNDQTQTCPVHWEGSLLDCSQGFDNSNDFKLAWMWVEVSCNGGEPLKIRLYSKEELAPYTHVQG